MIVFSYTNLIKYTKNVLGVSGKNKQNTAIWQLFCDFRFEHDYFFTQIYQYSERYVMLHLV